MPTSFARRFIRAAVVCLSLLGIQVARAATPVTFDTSFEGASLGTIEPLGEASFRLHVRGQQDEHGRNRQASWYHFRMDGVRGRDLTLTLTDFVGEYNGRPGACPMGPEIVPVWSHDGERWQPVPAIDWDDRSKEATIRLRPESDTIWVAHQPPYTPTRLARLLEEVDRCEHARVEVIGKTVRGRDLTMVTVTDPETFRDDGRVTVWLMARQHAWESGTSYVMEGALRWAASDEPAARALRRKVIFVFTPMVDLDGCAAGQVRFNALGYDVNRHWDEVDPKRKADLARMPEISYVKKAILAHARTVAPIALLVNLHNTETGEYLSTRANDEPIRARITTLSDRLQRESTFRPHVAPTFGAARDGTTSMLYDEARIPVVLMEQRIARDPATHQPPPPEKRVAFGAQLIRIMAETARP